MIKRYGVLDIGTNSVRFLVADIEKLPSGKVNAVPVWRHLDTARLGAGLGQNQGNEQDSKDNEQDLQAVYLKADAIERTIEAIARGVDELRCLGVERIEAIATAAVREAENGEEFCRLVFKRCGVQIKVLSGFEEGYLSYHGAIADLPDIHNPVVLDIGGGSAEVVFALPDKRLWQASYKLGAVRLTEVGWSLAEIKKAYLPVREPLSMLKGEPVLVAVGGTATTAASILLELEEYQSELIHGTKISLEQIMAMEQKLSSMSLEQRKKVKGLQPKRADIIPAGLSSLQALMEVAGFTELIVSESDLMLGVLQNPQYIGD